MAQLVKKNDSDASRRRLFFFLVDAVDALTPETGVTGQPEVSVDGGAWAGEGSVSTLVEIGNGHYYADVAQTVININSGTVIGRFKNAATAEAPSLNQLQVVTYDWVNFGATILARIGTITGSGVNTILGFFQALFRKNATLPTDIGGTFTPTTDSTEALEESISAAKGSGFATGTDSLKQIRAAVETIVQAAGGGAGGGVGGRAASLQTQAGFFISNLIDSVRQATDEPSVDSRYTDGAILLLARECWQTIWSDLAALGDQMLPCVRWDVTTQSGVQDYALPANCGSVVAIRQLRQDTGLPSHDLMPRSIYSPFGPGWTIEGKLLRFTPIPTTAETWRVEYLPSAEVGFLEGVAVGSISSDGLTVSLGTPTAGSLDTRQNAYGGYLVRVTGPDGYETEERMISASAWNGSSETVDCTVSPAFTATDIVGASGATYEVIPAYGPTLLGLLSTSIAMRIHANCSDTKRLQAQELIYQRQLAALRRMAVSVQTRRAMSFDAEDQQHSY